MVLGHEYPWIVPQSQAESASRPTMAPNWTLALTALRRCLGLWWDEISLMGLERGLASSGPTTGGQKCWSHKLFKVGFVWICWFKINDYPYDPSSTQNIGFQSKNPPKKTENQIQGKQQEKNKRTTTREPEKTRNKNKNKNWGKCSFFIIIFCLFDSCFFWWLFLSSCFFGFSVFDCFIFFGLKSTFSVLHGVIKLPSGNFTVSYGTSPFKGVVFLNHLSNYQYLDLENETIDIHRLAMDWYHIRSGYLTVRHGKIHPFLRTVNHLFLWAIYTMAMLNNQRVYLSGSMIIFH